MNFEFEDSIELQQFLSTASDEDLLELAKEHLPCISDAFCEFETYLWEEEGFNEFIPLLVITEGKNISKESLLYLRDNLGSGGDGERYARILSVLWMAHPDHDFNELIAPYTREQAYEFTLSAPNRAFLEIVYKTYSHEEIVESAKYDAANEQNYVDQEDLQKYDELIAAKMKL